MKWLEFPGAWSIYDIGRTGWHSYLSNPSFKQLGHNWEPVRFVYSIQGPGAWLDMTINWGGNTYEGVSATSDLTYNMHFYPTPGTTLGSYMILLDNPPEDLGCPYVFTWGGQGYLKDNNLLPISIKSRGADVEDYYRLEQPRALSDFLALTSDHFSMIFVAYPLLPL